MLQACRNLVYKMIWLDPGQTQYMWSEHWTLEDENPLSNSPGIIHGNPVIPWSLRKMSHLQSVMVEWCCPLCLLEFRVFLWMKRHSFVEKLIERKKNRCSVQNDRVLDGVGYSPIAKRVFVRRGRKTQQRVRWPPNIRSIQYIPHYNW